LITFFDFACSAIAGISRMTAATFVRNLNAVVLLEVVAILRQNESN